jgi:hypothetical protein
MSQRISTGVTRGESEGRGDDVRRGRRECCGPHEYRGFAIPGARRKAGTAPRSRAGGALDEVDKTGILTDGLP